MSITSTRITTVVFTGDVSATFNAQAASNTQAPGQSVLVTLTTGNNTITPPTGGSVPNSVTITPPAGNTQTITLKGVSGDTGISLHKTNPCTITFFNPTDTFVLVAGATITGVRMTWS